MEKPSPFSEDDDKTFQMFLETLLCLRHPIRHCDPRVIRKHGIFRMKLPFWRDVLCHPASGIGGGLLGVLGTVLLNVLRVLP